MARRGNGEAVLPQYEGRPHPDTKRLARALGRLPSEWLEMKGKVSSERTLNI